ncbi:MAG: glpK [Akkermansiaceae bacterium]|nr:glpK [Akkermansiaceae bacterium]
MNPKYILALDQGTTSSRAILFDKSGANIATSQKEFRQIYPQPGWVEHDPMEIWSSQRATMSEVVSKSNVSYRDVAAIGITNQRETTIVWERETGKPIYNAIVWQDRRTADFCAKLKREGKEELFTAKTGKRLDPYFSGTKVRWILDHVDGARDLAKQGKLAFGTVDSWLVWKLTEGKVHVTDATNACRTLLYNIHEGHWDDELLEILDIPKEILPEVRSCSEIYGETEYGTPIAGMAGDQHAALFGQACFEKGMAKNTYGTGCFMLMNTGTQAVASKNNLLTTIAWKIGDKTEYALEGSIFIAGALIQWLRDEMKIIASAPDCDKLAATVEDSGGLYIVPAFTGLGAPHWDPYARGATFGITRGTNRAHFCRAALEAIALQSADLISSMEKDSGLKLAELRVDGGATRSDLLLQIQADILGTKVIRPKNTETTALGAAYLAGLAVGFWESREDIAKNWQVDTSYERKASEESVTKLRKGWDKAVTRSLKWEDPNEAHEA